MLASFNENAGRPCVEKKKIKMKNWSCVACTMINKPANKNCHMCEVPRSGSKKITAANADMPELVSNSNTAASTNILTDMERKTASVVLKARRRYANFHKLKIENVTKKMVEASSAGLNGWATNTSIQEHPFAFNARRDYANFHNLNIKNVTKEMVEADINLVSTNDRKSSLKKINNSRYNSKRFNTNSNALFHWKFFKHQKVSCRYLSLKGKYYNALIRERNYDDGTYQIDYEDGDKENRVPQERIVSGWLNKSRNSETTKFRKKDVNIILLTCLFFTLFCCCLPYFAIKKQTTALELLSNEENFMNFCGQEKFSELVMCKKVNNLMENQHSNTLFNVDVDSMKNQASTMLSLMNTTMNDIISWLRSHSGEIMRHTIVGILIFTLIYLIFLKMLILVADFCCYPCCYPSNRYVNRKKMTVRSKRHAY